jgi:hypothetical protein
LRKWLRQCLGHSDCKVFEVRIAGCLVSHSSCNPDAVAGT